MMKEAWMQSSGFRNYLRTGPEQLLTFYRKIQSAGAESSVHSKLEYQLQVRGHAGGKAAGKASDKTMSGREKPAIKAEGGRQGSATAQPSAHS